MRKKNKNKTSLNRDLFKKLARKYPTPLKLQRYLQTFKYNRESTLQSAASTFASKTAHCMEAAMLAAAVMEYLGFPPLVLSLESEDHLDHVVYVFKIKSKWGAIGFSRDIGLFGRAPIYRSMRDLAWSYFEPYIDKTGKITAYQIAHLDESKCDWRWSKQNVWKAENYLLKIPHQKLKSSTERVRRLRRLYLKSGPLKNQRGWW